MSSESSLNPHVEDIIHEQFAAAPKMKGPLTRFNATIARYGMYLSVVGLFHDRRDRLLSGLRPLCSEQFADLGRKSGAGADSLRDLIAAAVGVRDAGHIGMESLLVLLPDRLRDRIELVIHVCILLFGAAMAYNGWVLGKSVMHYKIANLGLPEAVRYVPLSLSGILIVLFSIEHIIALLRGEEVEPSWH